MTRSNQKELKRTLAVYVCKRVDQQTANMKDLSSSIRFRRKARRRIYKYSRIQCFLSSNMILKLFGDFWWVMREGERD